MLPLGVSMLWEPVEAGAALRERFGFGGLAEVSAWLSEVLRGTWAITAGDADRLVISDQNAVVWVASDRGPLVVKWSRAAGLFARLDASAELLGVLAARGVPVAAPVPSVDGRARVVLDGPHGPLSVTVLPELAGDWLDVADLAAVRSAGACLAVLHGVLRDQTSTRLARDQVAEGLRSRIERWSATGDRDLAPEASRRLADALAGLPEPHEAPQLVHHDFRAANLLVRDSEVVGVLDFDEMVVDHPVVDLAHSAVYPRHPVHRVGPDPAAGPRGVPRRLRVGAAARACRGAVVRRGRAVAVDRGHPRRRGPDRVGRRRPSPPRAATDASDDLMTTASPPRDLQLRDR